MQFLLRIFGQFATHIIEQLVVNCLLASLEIIECFSCQVLHHFAGQTLIGVFNFDFGDLNSLFETFYLNVDRICLHLQILHLRSYLLYCVLKFWEVFE
jgi:hypothetical protein